MRRALGALRSPVVKWAFLAIAVGLGVWAVASNWSQVADALAELSAWRVAAALAASAAYVWLTMLSWRRIIADLGSPIGLGAAVELFGVSQIGKYIPGGVWNIVAAAEIGAGHRIPRRRSVAAMAIAVLVSLVSGLAIGSVAFLVSPTEALRGWSWLVVAAVPLLVALLPPVLTRIIGLAFRVTRRPPLERTLTYRGLGMAVVWALAAWLLAGLQVWLLMTGIDADPTWTTLVLSTAGYALAWAAGFLFVVAPAGLGAREAVLGATLAGAVAGPVVLTVVLLSRVLLTAVDLAFAGVGLALGRRHRVAVSREDAVAEGGDA